MPSATRTSAPASRRAATRGRVGARGRRRRAPATRRGSNELGAERQAGRRVEDHPERLAGAREARAVRSGSSARTVPMPTAIASDSARQRWTRSRLRSPEIQGESPGAVAVRPSRDIASFSVTSGRPVRACLRNGWLRAAPRSPPRRRANSTSTPAVAKDPGPTAGGLLARVVGADHDPSDPGLEDRLRAGRLAALVGAGLERHVHRRPGRVLAAATQSSRAARSACRPPSSAWNPSPMTSPSRTMTAPTSGLGLTRPRPPSASSSARADVPDPWL